MQRNEIQLLINSAKASEKEYRWLEARESYEEAGELALDRRDFSKAAELYEQIGYSYYRAALQAETKEQFETRMRLSSQAYEKELELLKRNQGAEATAYHASAMAAYTSSCFEPDLSKMEALLEEWWTLESEALDTYEEEQNHLAIGKTCNNLMEYSVDRRYFFDFRKYIERTKELVDIGEKAIATLEKTNDKYELARAYCWTAWYYEKGKASMYNKRKNRMKSLTYSKKALSLSEEVGDGWLIGWSYNNLSSMSRRSQTFSSWLNKTLLVLEQGRAIKDNYMMLTAKWKLGLIIGMAMEFEEDPEKKRRELWKGVKWTEEAITQAKLINSPICLLLAQFSYCRLLLSLASLETALQEKKRLIEEALKVGKEGLEYSKNRNWAHSNFPKLALADALRWLSKIEPDNQEKRRLLEESLKIRTLRFAAQDFTPSDQRDPAKVAHHVSRAVFRFALTKSDIAELETDKDQKIELFNEAVFIWEKCLQKAENYAQTYAGPSTNRFEGFYYYDYGGILSQIYELTQEKRKIKRAIEVYEKASKFFKEFNLPIHAAEAHWKIASIHSQMGDHLKAAENYDTAAKEYDATIQKTPQLRTLCENYSKYMFAWSEIEKAKGSHAREEYANAVSHYETAAKLHESSEPWNYLATNYFAWAEMEKAEGQSRKENTRQAKKTFQKALQQFNKAEKSIKIKIIETSSSEEDELNQKLLKASDLRRKFCQARIQIEDAKLLDRQGKYLQSSRSYGDAAQKLGTIIEKIGVEAERKEMKYLGTLCQAWEKMASAEEATSSETYLEAAALFERAKEYCYTKKASLWALGNSNFCRGLAAGVEYQTMLDVEDHNRAKGYIQNAATNYFKAGYKNASEYAKATLRLFDAYLFMNQAEREIDPEKRVRQYQLAENLLRLASGAFSVAQQPEKTVQVKQILENVREEKKLAISFNEVLKAPSIASTTQSFTAPSPTSEVSVGLEQFQHANVQANLIAGMTKVKVGESFCLSIEFVNAGKEPALLTRVEDFVPPNFTVVKKPEIYRLEDTCLNMKGKQIGSLKLVEAKLVLQPSKKGVYQLKPVVHYLDELGQSRSLQLKSVEIRVEEVILADRVPTGTKELDSLLLGGIPKEYAVVLTGPPSDERELVVRNFLEAGLGEGQTSFYVTTEAEGTEKLLEQKGFYLFLCNPKPKVEVPDQLNIYKLHGKADINNLNIALLQAYRTIDQTSNKRICINIISDVLANYTVKTARKWIAEQITDLISKNFTILAVINPLVHTPEELNNLLELFDGEISLYQIEDPVEYKKSLRVKKLRNQDYIKNPICLT